MGIDRTDTGRGVVDGTPGDDRIDATYTADPEGDVVDGGDAVLSGETGDDDIINGGAGDDTINGGAGNDEIFGGGGSDDISGGAGDDLLVGDTDLGDGPSVREGFHWDQAPDPDGADCRPGIDDGDTLTSFTQNTGNVDVTFTGTSPGPTLFSSDPTYVAGLDTGGAPPDADSSLDNVLQNGQTSTYTLDFSNAVENAAFRVNDVDGDGVVHISALDADGNPITVNLTAGCRLKLTDTDGVAGADSAFAPSGRYGGETNPDYSVLVEIPGPVSQITINHSQDGPLTSGIKMSDVYFDSVADVEPGDDTLSGGEGDDTLLGEVGDDLLLGGAGDDMLSGGGGEDTLDGGTGDDTIDGGEGDDTINGGTGDDSINGEGGNDVIYGEGGDDTILGGAGNDTLSGGSGDDVIRGQGGNDVILGDGGDDSLSGGKGNDFIAGGEGDDTIDGGAENDIIIGGAGADDMSGDSGRDTFLVESSEDGDGDTVDGGSGGDDYDILDLSGSGPFEIVDETDDPDGNSTSGTVNFLDAPGGNVTGSMTFTEIEKIIPCFTPGTVIATPRGERLVEDLQVGDRVITRDNGLQEIRWIGRRDLNGSALLQAGHLRPVLIRAGSLGRGLPERDLLVSPNHRVLICNEKSALYFEDREVLAAAKHLTDLEGVDAVTTGAVSYIHFMFDQHEVILSNGSWTESFQPGQQTLGDMGDAQRNEIYALFPDLRETQGIEAYQAARRSLKKHEAKLLTR